MQKLKTSDVAVDNYDKIMILCIEKPGLSGQKFNNDADDTIKKGY